VVHTIGAAVIKTLTLGALALAALGTAGRRRCTMPRFAWYGLGVAPATTIRQMPGRARDTRCAILHTLSVAPVARAAMTKQRRLGCDTCQSGEARGHLVPAAGLVESTLRRESWKRHLLTSYSNLRSLSAVVRRQFGDQERKLLGYIDTTEVAVVHISVPIGVRQNDVDHSACAAQG